MQGAAIFFAAGAAFFWWRSTKVDLPEVRNSQNDFIADLRVWSAGFKRIGRLNAAGAGCAATSALLLGIDLALRF